MRQSVGQSYSEAGYREMEMAINMQWRKHTSMWLFGIWLAGNMAALVA